MKRGKSLISVWIVLVILFSAMFLTSPVNVMAQVVAQEGVKFDVSQSMKDNLKMFIGKNIYISLRSGKTYQGVLKSVGDHFIHLEKISERNFFDALVRIDDISAIEAQFRGYK
jgi:small nuclear ribonucleoprotein (snRNP)-like protein